MARDDVLVRVGVAARQVQQRVEMVHARRHQGCLGAARQGSPTVRWNTSKGHV